MSESITWLSKKQNSVALSTCEAEYMALSKAATEAIYLHKLLHEIDFKTPKEAPKTHQEIQEIPTIYCDNQGAIALANNPEFHSKSKHIENHYHYVREHLEENLLQIQYVKTTDMLTDGLTKALLHQKFESFLKLLNLQGTNLS